MSDKTVVTASSSRLQFIPKPPRGIPKLWGFKPLDFE
jgi:hypothetical protein